ncbi:MAG: CPBP family intramembrane metalloprotease [Lachnospiraceae bacterium]|nr:CPBP family intramembrane metalloprotease [Lachnospiraceae bacterium]
MNQKLYDFLKSLIPFALYVGVVLVVYFLFAIYASAVTHNVEEAEKLINNNLLQMTALVDALLIPLFYLMWKSDRMLYPLKKTNMPLFTWSILALIGASACLALNYMLGMFMPQAILETYDEASEVLWNESLQWLSFLAVVILAPLCEEMMFRGLIYTRMRVLMKAPYTILISGLLFGFFHGNALQFIYAFFLGILLAYMMEIYHTVWAPIIVHGSANLISWFLTYIAMIPSDDGGILDYSVLAGTMLITFTGLFGIVYSKKIITKKSKSEEHHE